MVVQGKKVEKPMNLKDALEMGFTYGHRALQRGYVSRKTTPEEQTIRWGIKGPYVLLPNFQSTQYCIRQYLIPPEGWTDNTYTPSP